MFSDFLDAAFSVISNPSAKIFHIQLILMHFAIAIHDLIWYSHDLQFGKINQRPNRVCADDYIVTGGLNIEIPSF